MFKALIDRVYDKWQGRFKNGIGFSLGDCGCNRFANGEYIGIIHGPTILSTGTGHWPWYIFEAGYCTGPLSVWHVGLLGFTVGKILRHNIDAETQEIVGPDKTNLYWFFKGLNHADQQLEDILK